MGLLIGLVVAVLIAAFFLASLVGFAKFKAVETHKRNPDAYLDALFDGSKEVVTVNPAVTLPVDALTVGAGERGYRLQNTIQRGKKNVTLVFERHSSTAA